MIETAELVLCRSAWCGDSFLEPEGWNGMCPSCISLIDEHLAYGHTSAIDGCIECDRAAVAHYQAATRAAA